jgi:cholesterol transport system auxiliary component
MMRLVVVALSLLLFGCVSHRPTPALYSFDASGEPANAAVRLHATIAIAAVTAPSWLRTDALVYRLDYQPAPRPIPYSLSEWQAPPAEMLTMRLRELIGAANSGFTLSRLDSDAVGYQLDVSLERFVQVFSRPGDSQCIVTMTATLLGPYDRLISQRTFNSERLAPSGDAAGGAHGLVQASNADLEQIVRWVAAALQPTQALRGGPTH